MSEEKQPQKKVPVWVWVVVAFFSFGVLGSLFGGNDSESESPQSQTSEEVVSEENLEEEALEEAAPESFSDLAGLESAITEEFGGLTNMDVPRDLNISFDEESGWLNVSYVLDENFTVGMMRTGAWGDIGDIFDMARKTDFVKELTVTAQFPLQNNLGEELGPQDVLIAYFDPEVYPRINTANLPGEMLADAATSVFLHPAFQD